MSKVLKKMFGLAFIFALALGSVACVEEKGPMEKAGEKIDETVDEVGDGLEEAGDEIEDAVDGNG